MNYQNVRVIINTFDLLEVQVSSGKKEKLDDNANTDYKGFNTKKKKLMSFILFRFK